MRLYVATRKWETWHIIAENQWDSSKATTAKREQTDNWCVGPQGRDFVHMSPSACQVCILENSCSGGNQRKHLINETKNKRKRKTNKNLLKNWVSHSVCVVWPEWAIVHVWCDLSEPARVCLSLFTEWLNSWQKMLNRKFRIENQI